MSDILLSVALQNVYDLWRSGRAELEEALILIGMRDHTGQLAKDMRKALQGHDSFSAAIAAQRAKELAAR